MSDADTPNVAAKIVANFVVEKGFTLEQLVGCVTAFLNGAIEREVRILREGGTQPVLYSWNDRHEQALSNVVNQIPIKSISGQLYSAIEVLANLAVRPSCAKKNRHVCRIINRLT